MALDTLSLHETPEGAVLKLRPAGMVVRALAWSLDLLIRVVVSIAVGVALSFFGKIGIGFSMLLYFLLEWFYNTLFEVLKGATPGKQRFGLMVVNDNGTPLTWSAALIRNLLRVVDFLPLFYGLGLLWGLFHPQGKRLGDLAAGTLVVYRDSVSDSSLEQAFSAVAAETPPKSLDYATQQALMAYAERAPQLSPARQIELAELLEPLHGRQGERAVQALYGYARHVAGEQ